jgi:hypothetical protein
MVWISAYNQLVNGHYGWLSMWKPATFSRVFTQLPLARGGAAALPECHIGVMVDLENLRSCEKRNESNSPHLNNVIVFKVKKNTTKKFFFT